MVVTEYNGSWPNQFLLLKNIYEKILSDKILRIEHVGSTAIAGMCAKPIIDIIIVIENDENFRAVKTGLESIGYLHNGDQGIAGREAFKRVNREDNEIKKNAGEYDVLDSINHHLYVCAENNFELKKQTQFRDYLNSHEEAKQQYCQIKKAIIEKTGNENRQGYVEMKAADYSWFFEEIMRKAEK